MNVLHGEVRGYQNFQTITTNQQYNDQTASLKNKVTARTLIKGKLCNSISSAHLYHFSLHQKH